MKRISVIVLGMLVCSFTNINSQNDVQKNHLKGRVKLIVYFSGKDTDQVTIYNNAGNVAEETYFISGTPNDTCRYSYDAEERLVETNSVSWRTVYNYNKDNRVSETRRYKVEDRTLMQRCLFYYDSQGNKSKEISYSGSGHLLYRSVTTIEANGDRKEVYYDAEGKIERNEECKFDADHLPGSYMLCRIFSGSKSIDNNEFHYYKFDAAGNWTERAAIISYSMERRGSTTTYADTSKRMIEYY